MTITDAQLLRFWTLRKSLNLYHFFRLFDVYNDCKHILYQCYKMRWEINFMNQEKKKIPGVTGKFGLGVQNEAGQSLTEFCQENTLVIANTLFQQHKRRLYTWTSTRWSIPKSDWLYSLQPKMEKLYIVSKTKTRSWLWLRPWTPYCQFRLKLKKVGKTTRPFRYDLNQIPHDYTV